MFLVSGFVSWRYIRGASVYVYDGLLAIGAEEQFLLLQVLDWMKGLERPLTFWTVEPLDVPPQSLRSSQQNTAIQPQTQGKGKTVCAAANLSGLSAACVFSLSTNQTVSCPEKCLSSHEILLSSHSFLPMKCDSRNQNLLSSFVA